MEYGEKTEKLEKLKMNTVGHEVWQEN